VTELTPLAEKLLDVPQALIRTALDLELADGAKAISTLSRRRIPRLRFPSSSSL
jgi:hypothetical protein